MYPTIQSLLTFCMVLPWGINTRYIKQFRKGDVKTLNIYSVAVNPNFPYAWGTFPSQYAANPQNDGVVFPYEALEPESITMVHEVGHWVGLLHTFQGVCSPSLF